MNFERAFPEANEQGLFRRAVQLEKFFDLRDGDSRRPVHGKTVGAGANRRKGNPPHSVFLRQIERAPIAACEQLIFAVPAVAPDRTDGVNHPLRRQPVAFGDFRLTARAPA